MRTPPTRIYPQQNHSAETDTSSRSSNPPRRLLTSLWTRSSRTQHSSPHDPLWRLPSDFVVTEKRSKVQGPVSGEKGFGSQTPKGTGDRKAKGVGRRRGAYTNPGKEIDSQKH